MSRLKLAFVVVMAAGVTAAQQAPLEPASGEAVVAKGEIAGVVVSAKTGEPLRSARVMLRASAQGDSRTRPPNNSEAFSGINGTFSFSDLPPGDYTVFATKAGYGIRYGIDFDSQVRLGQDETCDDVVLRMLPSAVVTGRVLDAYGEPLPGASVSALARRYFAGETRWMPNHSVETNDLGEYRLYGLAPGRYVVAVSSPRSPGPRGVAIHEFAASFHHGADSPEQASALALSWGSEVAGIDFRLGPAPETTIQGVVIQSSTGEPCDECMVILQEETGLRGFGLTPTREGIFLMRGVPPGPGWVMAGYRGPAGRASERVLVPASGAIDVKLVVGNSPTLSAEVVLEDPPEQQEEAAPQGEDGQQRQGIFVSLQARGMNIWGPPPRANAPAKGGPVEFRNLATGDYRIRAGAANGGYLRAISLDGRELERPEITVGPDISLSGLKLHIAFDGGTIVGTVKYAAGTIPQARIWVQVMSEPGASLYAEREVLLMEAGEFRRAGIVPGRYALYALPRADVFDLDDPEIRRALEPYAKRVTVEKRQTVKVELNYIPEPL
jgi:hypothetical protein